MGGTGVGKCLLFASAGVQFRGHWEPVTGCGTDHKEMQKGSAAVQSCSVRGEMLLSKCDCIIVESS